MTAINPTAASIAVVGAGLAGAACAQALLAAGCRVTVFDKARGPGGRLATRRSSWRDATGCEHAVALDHGSPGFTATTPSFKAEMAALFEKGVVARWQPRPGPKSLALDERAALWVPAPSLPSLCAHLLTGATTVWERPVQSLQRHGRQWRLDASRGLFDAVVVAIPPAQAQGLLATHVSEWAQRTALSMMQPCWTLMGVASADAGDGDWDASVPAHGPLAWVARNESRPGRAPAQPGTVQWVAHASAGWSREHLEDSAQSVQEALVAALVVAVGHPLHWRSCTVHRWRYALPHAHNAAPRAESWCNATLGLGVCGDFLGGAGAEGAWLSGRHLAQQLLGRDDAPAKRISPAPSGAKALVHHPAPTDRCGAESLSFHNPGATA